MKDMYDGFIPNKTSKYVINGVAIAYFLTSCTLILNLFPALFNTPAFTEAQQYQWVAPTNYQLLAIALTALGQLAWALAPFIVTAMLFKSRHDSIVYSIGLTIVGWWGRELIYFSNAGSILVAGIWTACTIVMILYRKEFD